MTELKIEHILILAIVAFVLYHFIGRCNCMRSIDGFSVGIPACSDWPDSEYWCTMAPGTWHIDNCKWESAAPDWAVELGYDDLWGYDCVDK